MKHVRNAQTCLGRLPGHRRILSISLGLVVCWAAIFFSSGVQATIIFDNFDSDGGFSGIYNFGCAGARNDPPDVDAVRGAVSFNVTGGNFYLSSITLPICFYQGEPKDILRVRLTGDSGNAPGATLEVLSENQLWPDFANPFTTTTILTSSNHPLLTDGSTYWIVTELTKFVELDKFVFYSWFFNTSKITVPTLYQVRKGGLLPEDPWTGALSEDLNVAFRVEGYTVPLPASCWFLGFSLVIFAAYRRRSRG